MRVLLVDDHPVVRAGLRAVLEASGIDVVAEAASGEEALELAEQLRPEVVLCDLRLGEGINGVEVTAALNSRAGGPAVVILTTYDRDSELLGAIDAGALGYVLKDEPPEQITRATTWPPARYLSRNIRPGDGGCSNRPAHAPEREVLTPCHRGNEQRSPIRCSFLKPVTHLVHIFEKFDVTSRGQVACGPGRSHDQ